MILEAKQVDIDEDDYYSNPCISQSMVNRVIRGRLEDWSEPFGGTKYTRMGRALHGALLEQQPIPGSLKSSEKHLVRECLEHLHNHQMVCQIMGSSLATEKAYSGNLKLGEYVEEFRAKTDIETQHATWDLKFTSEEKSFSSGHHVEKWGLHIQGGFYQAVREKIEGVRKPYGIIACHHKPVLWVEVVKIPQEWLDVGLSIFLEVAGEIAKIKNIYGYSDSRYTHSQVLEVQGSPRRVGVFNVV